MFSPFPSCPSRMIKWISMSCRDCIREFSNALKWCCSSSLIDILIHTHNTVQCGNPCLRLVRAQGGSLHAESYSGLTLGFVQVSSLQLIIMPLLILTLASYLSHLEIKEYYCYCRSSFEFSPCRTQSFCTTGILWEAQQRTWRAPAISKQSQSLRGVSKAGTVSVSAPHCPLCLYGTVYFPLWECTAELLGETKSEVNIFGCDVASCFLVNFTIPDFSSPSSRASCFPWITRKLLSAKIFCSLQECCFS